MLISLGFAALAALAVVVATAIVVRLQHIEAEDAQRELEVYKTESAAKISAAETVGLSAKAEAATAQAQIEEAKARQREAELKLELMRKHLAQRNLADEAAFLEPLRGLPPATFRVLYVRDTTDAFHLAVSLIIALQKIGWKALENPRPIEARDSIMRGVPSLPDGSAMSVGAQPTGISVSVKNVETPLAEALVKAFVAAFGEGNASRNETLPDDSFLIVIAPRM